MPLHSSRELNRKFQEKLVGKVVLKGSVYALFAETIADRTNCMAYAPFFEERYPLSLERKTEGRCAGCIFHRNFRISQRFRNSRTVMFLLELGELLEEWTKKKSMEDLARCMALNVDRVWLKTPESEILTAVSDIRPGDQNRDSYREYDSYGRSS